MGSSTRRTANPITETETQGALDVLVGAMTEDFMSPSKAVAPSAVALLVSRGVTERNGRASYILLRLVEAGAIEPIGGSRSYRIKRKTVAVGRVPIMPAATQEAYEETIRRLGHQVSELTDQLQSKNSKHRLEIDDLKNLLVAANSFITKLEADAELMQRQLTKLDDPVEPSKDVRTIMERVLND